MQLPTDYADACVDEPLTLPNVSSAILGLIIEFLEEYTLGEPMKTIPQAYFLYKNDFSCLIVIFILLVYLFSLFLGQNVCQIFLD